MVIDRKNFLFSTSVARAETNAIWLTLLESDKVNGLDPQKYLTKILTVVPQLGPFPTEKELEPYLPWN
ncbi:transposase [Ligilactobacillus acidipiscis]|uniref:transposase domain-containing protein n=1 Tax=Ligilactobacillus acidipiscis TaxID=89059 RepID=UPI000A23A003|nr:transposase [Ligilactobacillus acidipiscis]